MSKNDILTDNAVAYIDSLLTAEGIAENNLCPFDPFGEGRYKSSPPTKRCCIRRFRCFAAR